MEGGNVGNKNFVQNLRNHDKQGKMSALFDFLHSNQNKGALDQMNVHKIESNALFEQLMNQGKPAQVPQARRQSIGDALLDAKKKDKSQDDFDEDEDVEVDNLFFDEMQEAEP